MIILARSLLFAFAAPQRALLDSQYHTHGPLDPTITRPAELLLSERGRELSTALQSLQLMRKAYLQGHLTGNEGYTQAYLKLCRCLENCFLPDPSIYRLAGWYNVRTLHKKLLQRLIALKDEPELLIESIAWMKLPPKDAYGFVERDLREKGKIEGLFRNLKPTLSIKHLQQLNSILHSPLTLSKRIYMEGYALTNLKGLLMGGNAARSDIIWLFEAVTASMVDREDLTLQFQTFLKAATSASSADCQSLMRTYSLRGRIDKSIYQSLLRPHLYKHNMKDARGIIEAIKFTVLSESEDYPLLKNLYQLLGNESPINSKQLYELHILSHYLRVKGKSVQLGAQLQKRLIDFCRQRSEAKATISNLIATKQRKEKNLYTSECLNVERQRLTELQATKRSVFEEAFRSRLSNLAVNNMRLYEKPSFCCFELDFCLHDPASQLLIDLEVEGLQYVFSSDRMARWQQLRQQLLQHYGIKVNRLKYYEFLEKPYLNQADLPPKKGKFFKKK